MSGIPGEWTRLGFEMTKYGRHVGHHLIPVWSLLLYHIGYILRLKQKQKQKHISNRLI